MISFLGIMKKRYHNFINFWIIKYIITYFKNLYNKTIETNSILRKQFLQFLPFLLASAFTGFVAFIYSKIFTYSEQLSHFIFSINPYLIFISTPFSFLLSWWIVKQFAPLSRGSGIPQVMAAIEISKTSENLQEKKLLGFRIIIIKILASAIKIIGGGIVGREGPTIQIASSIFSEVKKRLPTWWLPISQKNILIAGASSGLAAAFNTPLGGIIFAIEELSKFHIRYYKSPLFIAVIIAGLTAQGFGGNYLYLAYPKTSYTGYLIFIAILLTAVLAGYFGSKMGTVLYYFMKIFKKVRNSKYEILIVICCGLYVAFFIFWLGTEAMGSGKEIMERILFTDNKTVQWYLPFVRMNGLIASFGFGGAGGVFAPSLSAGATFGALIAELFEFGGSNANILILIGMTAFLTGVTRAPFTSAIIIFEMTDRHSIIFFLLFAGILANIIASYVNKESFYDLLKKDFIKEVSD